jgi:hypothetical protein
MSIFNGLLQTMSKIKKISGSQKRHACTSSSSFLMVLSATRASTGSGGTTLITTIYFSPPLWIINYVMINSFRTCSKDLLYVLLSRYYQLQSFIREFEDYFLILVFNKASYSWMVAFFSTCYNMNHVISKLKKFKKKKKKKRCFSYSLLALIFRCFF